MLWELAIVVTVTSIGFWFGWFSCRGTYRREFELEATREYDRTLPDEPGDAVVWAYKVNALRHAAAKLGSKKYVGDSRPRN